MPTFKEALVSDPYIGQRCPLFLQYGYCLGILQYISVTGESKFFTIRSTADALNACVGQLRELPSPAREPLVADLILFFDSFHSRLSNSKMPDEKAIRSTNPKVKIQSRAEAMTDLTSFDANIMGIINRSLGSCPDGSAVLLGRACAKFECAEVTDNQSTRVMKALISVTNQLGLDEPEVQSIITVASTEITKSKIRNKKPMGVLKVALDRELQNLLPSFWQPSSYGKSRVAGVEVSDVEYDVLAALRRAGQKGLFADELNEIRASASHTLKAIRRHPILSQYVSKQRKAIWLDHTVPLPPK